jgi:dTDP-4-dehydrorhamnose 3,5-epimerase
MLFQPCSIPDVIIIQPRIFGDDRGFFMETWHYEKFKTAGLDTVFVQDNHSKSGKGILRGLHYQIKQPQGKLVRVIQGEVFDVAVDIRKSSPTFGKWVGDYLTDENRKMLWVPEGFAHGFLVTSETAEVCYKCTDYYAPEYERSMRWDDPDINISWPLSNGALPLLSDKDRNGAWFKDAEVFA